MWPWAIDFPSLDLSLLPHKVEIILLASQIYSETRHQALAHPCVPVRELTENLPGDHGASSMILKLVTRRTQAIAYLTNMSPIHPNSGNPVQAAPPQGLYRYKYQAASANGAGFRGWGSL